MNSRPCFNLVGDIDSAEVASGGAVYPSALTKAGFCRTGSCGQDQRGNLVSPGVYAVFTEAPGVRHRDKIAVFR